MLTADQQAEIEASRAVTTPTLRATEAGAESALHVVQPVLDTGFDLLGRSGDAGLDVLGSFGGSLGLAGKTDARARTSRRLLIGVRTLARCDTADPVAPGATIAA